MFVILYRYFIYAACKVAEASYQDTSYLSHYYTFICDYPLRLCTPLIILLHLSRIASEICHIRNMSQCCFDTVQLFMVKCYG